MKKGLYYFGVIALLLGLLCGLCSCHSAPAEKSGEVAVPVIVTTVKTQDLAVPVFTSGRLFPGTVVKLSFKVGGLLKSVDVNPGESVSKGQMLASLNLSEINARFNQAQKGFAKGKRDLERVENLFNDKAATLEQLQDVRTAFEVAEADLKIAQFNREHAVIKAPFQGKILKKLAEPNEMIGPGAQVFLFGSTEELWIVRSGVSERDIVRLGLEDKAEVYFDAYPGVEFPASVSQITQALSSESGTYEVELAINRESSHDYKLMAGFVAKAKIEPTARDSFFVIPLAAMVEGEGDRAIVYTVKEQRAVSREIIVSHIFQDMLAVRLGLEVGDVVVTSGSAYLRDGALVKIGEK